METQKAENEILKQDGPKVNFPIRGDSELKYRLETEAKTLGLKFSPYCESILLNFSNVEQGGKKAMTEVAETKRKNSMLELELANEKARHKIEMEEFKSKLAAVETDSVNKTSRNKNEVEELKKQNASLGSQLSIYQDERLLWLFEQMKGEIKNVKAAYEGNFQIAIKEPKDLLLLMTYSFRLKK